MPVDKLWDYLADYDRVVRLGWLNASAHRIKGTRDGEVRYEARAVWEGIPSTYIVRLEDAERPRSLAWATSRAGSRSCVRFDLRQAGPTQSDVTVTLNLRNKKVLRPFEPVAWGLLRPAFLRTVQSIQRLDGAV